MRKFIRLIALILLLPCTSALAGPPARKWTTYVDFSFEYKQRQLVDSSDERVTQHFKVPGPGLLRTTFIQEPFHSTQVRRTDSGHFDVSLSAGGAQLGYPAIARFQEPKAEQDGVPIRWCAVGEVLEAQPAWVAFIPPVNYQMTWQLGCKIRMVVEFSPGLLSPGEKPSPSAAYLGGVEPPPVGKIRYYDVGVIDEQGRRSGVIRPQWVIHPDGTIVGPGVWHAQYTKTPDGTLNVKLTLDSNGAQEAFTIKLSSDGFIAYKNGKPYRWGKLTRTE